ncbi:hypothetical protein ACFL1S_08640 [Pseudomonadota bacterium]
MKRLTTILLPLPVIAFSMLLASGCATVTKGTDQEVTVTTDPEGARCTLTREGAILAVIDPTPGTITVQKSKKNVSVSCELPEYKDSSGMLESKFSDMTLGNVLFGGIVGIAIDASSGASRQYDPIVTLTMIPERFPTAEERDVFFDKMRDDFVRDSEKSMKLIAQKCTPDTCEFEKKEAKKAKATRLSEIERERGIAFIGDSTASLAQKQAGKEGTGEVSASLANQTISASNVSPMIGMWRGEIIDTAGFSASFSMQLEDQVGADFVGLASTSGSHISCKDSDLKLAPNGGDEYILTIERGGCSGEGKLSHSGQLVKGRIKFNAVQGSPFSMKLVKYQ